MNGRDETTRIQLEEILKDSRRLDWLSNQGKVSVQGVFEWEYKTYETSLRKAIDAVMRAKEGAVAK
jgi:hypothetical protein